MQNQCSAIYPPVQTECQAAPPLYGKRPLFRQSLHTILEPKRLWYNVYMSSACQCLTLHAADAACQESLV